MAAWIVIALKRNGAYALDIQVATTWIEASCLKVESIVTTKDREGQNKIWLI